MTTLCSRCNESLVNAELPCGFCVLDRRREAVTKLAAAAKSGGDAALAARVDAIDTLRNLGHSPDEVLLARAQALDGLSTDQILQGLVDGVGEREAVAALMAETDKAFIAVKTIRQRNAESPPIPGTVGAWMLPDCEARRDELKAFLDDWFAYDFAPVQPEAA